MWFHVPQSPMGNTKNKVGVGCSDQSIAFRWVTTATPYLDDSGGIIADALMQAIEACCSRLPRIAIERLNASWADQSAVPTHTFAVLPFESEHRTHFIEFVPVIESPGYIAVARDEISSFDWWGILYQSWPLAALFTSLAFLFGIAIWITDAHSNKSHFPRKFFKGFFVGLWWSYTTAVRISFNDLMPKSQLAKFVAALWIVTGTVLITIYCSTLTAVLTSTVTEFNCLKGKTVGTVQFGNGFKVAVESQAIPIEFSNVEKLFETISTANLDVGLIDYYVSYSNHLLMRRAGLRAIDFIKRPHYIGFVLGPYVNEAVKDCIQRVVALNESHYAHNIFFNTNVGHLQSKNSLSAQAEITRKLFHVISPYHLVALAGIWTVLFVSLILWDCIYQRTKERKNKSIDFK